MLSNFELWLNVKYLRITKNKRQKRMIRKQTVTNGVWFYS